MGLDLPRPPKGSFSWSAARSGHKDNEALALPALATMVCRITNGSALLPDVDGGEDNASTAARSIIRRATGGAARVGRDLRERQAARNDRAGRARSARAPGVLIPIGGSSPKEASSPKGRGYPLRQNQILLRFGRRDMKQFLNFTLPPYRGFHHGGVSLWPCSSRRQVTRHGRQPGGGERVRGRF